LLTKKTFGVDARYMIPFKSLDFALFLLT